jgi:hypothetical protein
MGWKVARTVAAWVIAPLLGLVAMVAPVLVWPPLEPYSSPLFPLLRNAQEHLGPGQLVWFFAAGMALGRLNDRHPWLLGLTAVSLLPIAAVAEVRVDPTSHTLLPLEMIFYAAYGAIVGAGVTASRRARARSRS